MKAAGRPCVRDVFTLAVVAAVVASSTRLRILSLNERNSGFGVEGEFGGVDDATFWIAPAHGESHSDDHDDQKDQSSQPKNKPREGSVF